MNSRDYNRSGFKIWRFFLDRSFALAHAIWPEIPGRPPCWRYALYFTTYIDSTFRGRICLFLEDPFAGN